MTAYNETDELLDWLGENGFIVAQVARWVVAHPSEQRDSNYNSLDPAWVVKLEDLKKIIEQYPREDKNFIKLSYPAGVNITLSEGHVKLIADVACKHTGMDILQIIHGAQ